MSVSTYKTQQSQYPEYYNMQSNKAGFPIGQLSLWLYINYQLDALIIIYS